MLLRQIRNPGFEGPDEVSYAVRRAPPACTSDCKKLAQRQAYDVGALALHVTRGRFQRPAQIVRLANGQLSLHWYASSKEAPPQTDESILVAVQPRCERRLHCSAM